MISNRHPQVVCIGGGGGGMWGTKANDKEKTFTRETLERSRSVFYSINIVSTHTLTQSSRVNDFGTASPIPRLNCSIVVHSLLSVFVFVSLTLSPITFQFGRFYLFVGFVLKRNFSCLNCGPYSTIYWVSSISVFWAQNSDIGVI